jgi:hypothetical protein
MFMAGLVFLGVSFWFPQRLATWAEEPLEIGNDVQQLLTKIEVLKEEKLIDKKRADFLMDQLRQVQEKAEGRNPTKTLEALDHVREQIAKTAQKAAESAKKTTEEYGKAEEAADSIRRNDEALEGKMKADALAELAKMVAKADAESQLLDMHIDPETMKALAESKLTTEQLKKLAEALKDSQSDLAKSLRKLHKAKLIDTKKLEECTECKSCEFVGARAFAELTKLVAEADAKKDPLDEHSDPETMKLFRARKPFADELEKIADALEDKKPQILRSLRFLHVAELIDDDTLKACLDAGKRDVAGVESMVTIAKALAKSGEKQIDAELVKLLRDPKLSAKELQKIADEVDEFHDDFAEMLCSLHREGRIDDFTLERCLEGCKCGNCKKCSGLSKSTAKSSSRRGGRGGLTRGPGASPLTWTDGTKEEGAKYKEETLPPSDLEQLKKSMVIGVGKVDPTKKESAPSQAGALRGSQAGGGAANSGTLLPQHRATVERFFDRSEKKKK